MRGRAGASSDLECCCSKFRTCRPHVGWVERFATKSRWVCVSLVPLRSREFDAVSLSVDTAVNSGQAACRAGQGQLRVSSEMWRGLGLTVTMGTHALSSRRSGARSPHRQLGQLRGQVLRRCVALRTRREGLGAQGGEVNEGKGLTRVSSNHLPSSRWWAGSHTCSGSRQSGF